MYGCGSTEHGQLPYLKFAGGQEGSASDDESADMSAEVGADVDALQPRNEITIPTQLRMPFLQVPPCASMCRHMCLYDRSTLIGDPLSTHACQPSLMPRENQMQAVPGTAGAWWRKCCLRVEGEVYRGMLAGCRLEGAGHPWSVGWWLVASAAPSSPALLMSSPSPNNPICWTGAYTTNPFALHHCVFNVLLSYFISLFSA